MDREGMKENREETLASGKPVGRDGIRQEKLRENRKTSLAVNLLIDDFIQKG